MPPTLYEQLLSQRAARYAQNTADDDYLQRAPNAGAGIGAGLLSGFSSRLQERQLESQIQLEDSKNRAREFVKSIPINEHNFPIALRLMAEIDSVKPSKMSFLDAFRKAPDPNEAAMARIYGLLKNAIPQDANLGSPARTEIQPLTSDQTTMLQAAQLAGGGSALTPKDRAVQIPATPPDPNKFQYEAESNFQPVGQIFHATDKAGNPVSYAAKIDKKKGNYTFEPVTDTAGNPLDLRTPTEVAAEVRAKAQEKIAGERTNNPVFKKMLANTGFAHMQQLDELPPAVFASEYAKAKAEIDADAQLNRDLKQSTINRNNATAPNPQTGLTPVQETAEKNKKFDAANGLFNKFSEARADLGKAQARLAGSYRKKPDGSPMYGVDDKGEPRIISPRESATYSTAKGEVTAAQKLMNSYGDLMESQFYDIYQVIRDGKGNVLDIKLLPEASERFRRQGVGKGPAPGSSSAPSRKDLINRSQAPARPVGSSWDEVMGRGSGITPPIDATDPKRP